MRNRNIEENYGVMGNDNSELSPSEFYRMMKEESEKSPTRNEIATEKGLETLRNNKNNAIKLNKTVRIQDIIMEFRRLADNGTLLYDGETTEGLLMKLTGAVLNLALTNEVSKKLDDVTPDNIVDIYERGKQSGYEDGYEKGQYDGETEGKKYSWEIAKQIFQLPREDFEENFQNISSIEYPEKAEMILMSIGVNNVYRK